MLLRTRLPIPLFTIVVLALLSFSPLWGQDGEEASLALGFMRADGTTEIAEFTGQAGQPSDTLLLTGIPGEPTGHRLVRLTNQRRINSGASPLKAASELMNSAQFHSQWMASHNCFDHNCPGEPVWTDRIQSAGYLYRTALAENIAAGYTSASAAVAAWVSSPAHRDTMFSNDFREAGGGYASNGSSAFTHYWTMDFGARNNTQGYPVYPVIINNEAWSTNSLQVSLYVHGSGWATHMRFQNEGGSWSSWQPFSATESWSLSCTNGPLAAVYAEIKRGSTVLASSDEIYVDIPLSVHPNPHMVFLSEQGAAPTVPASQQMAITCCSSWNAAADKQWIKLDSSTGTGSATIMVRLEDFPTQPPGTYTGTITIVTASQEQAEVQVTLAVTDGPLEHTYVPLNVTDE